MQNQSHQPDDRQDLQDHSQYWSDWSEIGIHENNHASPNGTPLPAPAASPSPPSYTTEIQEPTQQKPTQQRQHVNRKPLSGYNIIAHHPTTFHSEKEQKKQAHHSWTLEISAVAISLSAVVTVLIVLFYADNRPLVEYQFFISFNTIISILGAISRASLGFAIGSCLGQGKWNWFRRRSDSLIAFEKFEDASRGPWGSLWLLIWLRIRHWTALGALVTIVLLGFEPFLQAVISYQGEMDTTLSPKQPTLGAIQNLDAGIYVADAFASTLAETLPSNDSMSLLSFRSQPDLGMSAALYNGFYQGPSTETPNSAFTCPSGNCNWPLFTSLSVCSKCNDVSGKLEASKQYGKNLGTLSSWAMPLEGHFTSYSLPYVNLTNGDTEKAMFSALMAAVAVYQPNKTLTFADMNTMLVTVGIIKAGESYENGDTTWNETDITATECALYLCTNVYESKVERGVLEETIVKSWSSRDMESFRPLGNTTVSAYEEWEESKNYSLYKSYGDLERSDLQLTIPEDEARKINDLPENATLVFNITQNTLGSMSTFIFDAFFSSQRHPQLVWAQMENIGFSQPPVTQAIYESEDLSATFDRAAWSLSDWMRCYPNTTQTGVERQWVMHIHVNWNYLAFPVITVIAGCVFILLSMLETRRLQLEPWKNSVVETLTHSLDAEARAQLRVAEWRNSGAREAAKSVIVNFENSGSGLELRAHRRIS